MSQVHDKTQLGLDARTRVLVTGGGGFIGGALVSRLQKLGVSVRSFSRGNYAGLSSLGVEQLKGDLADAEAVRRACEGCGLVFHVAAKAGIWGARTDFYQANVVGTRNVIEACRAEGVGRLVFTSSPSVVFSGRDMRGADESVPYPARYTAYYPESKAAAERLVLSANAAGLSTTALRPHLVWGPGDNHIIPGIVARAKQGKLRWVGDRSNRVDFTYIDNVVEAHLLAAWRLSSPAFTPAGKAYFITDGDPVLLWDFIDSVLDCAGVSRVAKGIPHWAAYWLGGLLEAVYTLLKLPGEPRMTRFLAEELATDHWFSIDAARRDLGYVPLVGVAEGLTRLRTWFQTEPRFVGSS